MLHEPTWSTSAARRARRAREPRLRAVRIALLQVPAELLVVRARPDAAQAAARRLDHRRLRRRADLRHRRRAELDPRADRLPAVRRAPWRSRGCASCARCSRSTARCCGTTSTPRPRPASDLVVAATVLQCADRGDRVAHVVLAYDVHRMRRRRDPRPQPPRRSATTTRRCRRRAASGCSRVHVRACGRRKHERLRRGGSAAARASRRCAPRDADKGGRGAGRRREEGAKQALVGRAAAAATTSLVGPRSTTTATATAAARARTRATTTTTTATRASPEVRRLAVGSRVQHSVRGSARSRHGRAHADGVVAFDMGESRLPAREVAQVSRWAPTTCTRRSRCRRASRSARASSTQAAPAPSTTTSRSTRSRSSSSSTMARHTATKSPRGSSCNASNPSRRGGGAPAGARGARGGAGAGGARGGICCCAPATVPSRGTESRAFAAPGPACCSGATAAAAAAAAATAAAAAAEAGQALAKAAEMAKAVDEAEVVVAVEGRAPPKHSEPSPLPGRRDHDTNATAAAADDDEAADLGRGGGLSPSGGRSRRC